MIVAAVVKLQMLYFVVEIHRSTVSHIDISCSSDLFSNLTTNVNTSATIKIRRVD